MAPRVIKLREQGEPRQETEAELPPQRKRPEVGRYLLQVDRQTKGSYGTAQAAEAAGILIKKNYPKVQVSVYDSVDTANKLIDLPANSELLTLLAARARQRPKFLLHIRSQARRKQLMRTTLGMVGVATALLLAASFANVSAQTKQTTPQLACTEIKDEAACNHCRWVGASGKKKAGCAKAAKK